MNDGISLNDLKELQKAVFGSNKSKKRERDSSDLKPGELKQLPTPQNKRQKHTHHAFIEHLTTTTTTTTSSSSSTNNNKDDYDYDDRKTPDRFDRPILYSNIMLEQGGGMEPLGLQEKSVSLNGEVPENFKEVLKGPDMRRERAKYKKPTNYGVIHDDPTCSNRIPQNDGDRCIICFWGLNKNIRFGKDSKEIESTSLERQRFFTALKHSFHSIDHSVNEVEIYAYLANMWNKQVQELLQKMRDDTHGSKTQTIIDKDDADDNFFKKLNSFSDDSSDDDLVDNLSSDDCDDGVSPFDAIVDDDGNVSHNCPDIPPFVRLCDMEYHITNCINNFKGILKKQTVVFDQCFHMIATGELFKQRIQADLCENEPSTPKDDNARSPLRKTQADTNDDLSALKTETYIDDRALFKLIACSNQTCKLIEQSAKLDTTTYMPYSELMFFSCFN